MASEIGEWLNEHHPGFDDEAPPEDNENIADGTDYREEYYQEDLFLHSNIGLDGEDDGPPGYFEGTLVEDAWKVFTDLQSGTVVDATLGAMGVVTTIADGLKDPFALIGSQLYSWMLEHVEPMRKTLDALAGSPDMVEAYANSWTNISEELTSIGADWQAALDADIASWSGHTATAYRTYAAGLVDQLGAAAGVAASLASMTEKASKMVDAVRTLVSTILSDLAGALLSWTVQIAASVGTAAPAVAAQAAGRIATESAKISVLVTRLLDVLKDMAPYKEALQSILFTLLEPEEEPAPA